MNRGNTAHDIDMKELRYVCGVAIADYAAIISMGASTEMFERLGRLIDAAGATDWMASPEYSRQMMSEGLARKEHLKSALVEVLDEWRATCWSREDGGSDSHSEHWRGEAEAAERVHAFVVAL